MIPDQSIQQHSVEKQAFFDALGRAESQAIRNLAKKISYGVKQATSRAGLLPQDAEELLNDAVVITISNIREGKFKFMDFSPASYAAGVARRLIANRIRTKKPIAEELTDLPLISDLNPEKYMKDKERQSIVGQLLAKLGGTCQKLIRFKYFDQLKDKEIIEKKLIDFTSINSLKSKRSQCMKKLASMAKEEGIKEMI